ncbi:MAG: outer membrane lipoprotein LolB [Betaproteobacteria bacterium]
MINFRRIARRGRRDGELNFFLVGTLILVLATFVGCSAVPKVPSASTVGRSDDRQLAAQFSLTGRISVRVGDKIDSGQIRWQRSAVAERIGLYSPLGSQVAELVSEKTAGTATLRQGKELLTATSVADLTQSLLGVPLDLDRLAAWVQGQGLLENVSVDIEFADGEHWLVTAEGFQAVGRYQFASRVIARNKDTVVRLIVDEWLPE